MKKIIVLVLLFFSVKGVSQEKGIQFQNDLSWQEVEAKAKSENKFIFMDCYTTWCGPCRLMNSNVFPKGDVGNVINANFVAVKVQFDTSAEDNDQIKSWYKTAHEVGLKYGVVGYPTFLFFDPDGNLVHRTVGSSDPVTFIENAKNAINSENQYYTLLSKYKVGQNDSAFLHKLALAALMAYDINYSSKIANQYLKTQSNCILVRISILCNLLLLIAPI